MPRNKTHSQRVKLVAIAIVPHPFWLLKSFQQTVIKTPLLESFYTIFLPVGSIFLAPFAGRHSSNVGSKGSSLPSSKHRGTAD